MSEITLKAIEQLLDKKLKNVVTTADLQKAVAPLATQKGLEEQTEALARMVADTIATPFTKRFDRLEELLEVKDDVRVLKRQMAEIRSARHLSV
jgi:hypothetical protein